MIIKNVNVNKLHDEFLANGINPYPVVELKNGDGDFTFPNGVDMELAQQIIDAHDPAPYPELPSDKERIDMLENIILMMMEG